MLSIIVGIVVMKPIVVYFIILSVVKLIVMTPNNKPMSRWQN